jgi:Cell division protein FtsL
VTPPAGAAAAVQRARTVAPGSPRVAPRGPRRVSGPVRRPAPRPPRAVESPAPERRGLVVGLLAALRGHSLGRLDRLIGGRAWIALIAFALIGIVALQLLVLKLNASIGRTLEREGSLQRENAALSIESSELAAGNRVESRAAALGMELVPVGSLRFLSVHPRADAAHAAAALSASQHVSGASEEASTGTASPETSVAGAPASSQAAASGPTSTEASSQAAAGATSPAAPTYGESTAPTAGTPTSPSAPAPSAAEPASGEAAVAGAAEAAPAGGGESTQAGGAG